MTWCIETRPVTPDNDRTPTGPWTTEGLGDSTGWPSRPDAYEALVELLRDCPDWEDGYEFRVREEVPS